jgi:hypothetical protein
MTKNCLICNKIFKVIAPSREKRTKYCSKQCCLIGRRKGILKQCSICDTKIYVKRAYLLRGYGNFCSRKCFNWSRKGEMKKCCICGKNFYAHKYNFLIRKCCSKKCAGEWNRKLFTGVGSYNWQGGKTIFQTQIRHCYKYQLWRKKVFERDNWTCQKCKKRGIILNADHIIPFALILTKNNIKTLNDALTCEELWDINNGQTLCVDCHKKTDTYLTYNR